MVMHNSYRTPVTKENVCVGLSVIDDEGNVGRVIESNDLHNIYVIFEGNSSIVNIDGVDTECGGSALICLVEGCELYESGQLFLK
jgi:hypothetical protein